MLLTKKKFLIYAFKKSQGYKWSCLSLQAVGIKLRCLTEVAYSYIYLIWYLLYFSLKCLTSGTGKSYSKEFDAWNSFQRLLNH